MEDLKISLPWSHLWFKCFLAQMHLIPWGQTAKRKSLKTGCVVVVIMTYIVLDQTDHLLNIFALKYFLRVDNHCQESQKIVKIILLGYYGYWLYCMFFCHNNLWQIYQCILCKINNIILHWWNSISAVGAIL